MVSFLSRCVCANVCVAMTGEVGNSCVCGCLKEVFVRNRVYDVVLLTLVCLLSLCVCYGMLTSLSLFIVCVCLHTLL